MQRHGVISDFMITECQTAPTAQILFQNKLEKTCVKIRVFVEPSLKNVLQKRTVRASMLRMRLSKLSQGDSKNFHPMAYGGFTWGLSVRYDKIIYHRRYKV